MPKIRKRNNVARSVGALFLWLAFLAMILKVLLEGNNIALFNPKGVIAQQQLNLMLLIVGILLIVAVPTIVLLYFTAWKYRESNGKAKRDPGAGHGRLLTLSIWLIPTVFMTVLAVIMWSAAHRLAPQKVVDSTAKPLTIQVVAQRWKWVFIYPEQQVATVNYVLIPTGTPVTFELTADDAPMSSFWIPNLGGMLYAMTGHVNQLNLLTDTPGDYTGSSAEINGAGFADMKFTAKVASKQEFDGWVQGVKQQTAVLDAAEYEKLVKPSESNPPVSYSAVESGLYDKVLMKYMGPGHDHQAASHDPGGHE
jgi:cytochrome o ubiquinol oxidase subunit II